MCPPTIGSANGEREAVLDAARQMLVAARTAPKTGGIDDVSTSIVYGKEKNAIADEMEKIAEERKSEEFRRDAKSVRDSEAVVLVGVRGSQGFGIKCGSCGYESCAEFSQTKKKQGKDFAGPTCIFKALDLGIALGSAAKTAGVLNVDNRIMYRVGTAAFRMKLLPEATIIMGISMSANGKNIYFDRPHKA